MRALGGALFAGVGRVRQASLETEIAAMETMSTGVRAQQHSSKYVDWRSRCSCAALHADAQRFRPT